MGTTNKGFFEYDLLLSFLFLLITIISLLSITSKLAEINLNKFRYAELQQQALCFSDQILKNSDNGFATYNPKFKHIVDNEITEKNLANIPENLCQLKLGNKILFSKECKKEFCISVQRLAYNRIQKRPQILEVKFCEE